MTTDFKITNIADYGQFGGFTEDGHAFVASFPLFIIRVAWYKGLDLESLADGFGLGLGTHGDWSAIRGSSPRAILAMFNEACIFLELTR